MANGRKDSNSKSPFYIVQSKTNFTKSWILDYFFSDFLIFANKCQGQDNAYKSEFKGTEEQDPHSVTRKRIQKCQHKNERNQSYISQ